MADSRFADAERELRACLQQAPDSVEANCDDGAAAQHAKGVAGKPPSTWPNCCGWDASRSRILILLGSLQESYEDTAVIDTAHVSISGRSAAGRRTGPHRSCAVNKVREAQELLQKVAGQVSRTSRSPGAAGPTAARSETGERVPALASGACRPAAQAHPEVWFTRATWAERHDQLQAAARCYWETLRRAPHHRIANYNLGVVLQAVGSTRGRRAVPAALPGHCRIWRRRSSPCSRDGPNVEAMQRAAQLTEAQGRLWEAWGWQTAVLSIAPGHRKPPPRATACAHGSTKTSRRWSSRARRPPSRWISATIRCRTFRAPAADAPAGRPPGITPVNFVDQAAEIGIEFRYFDSWVAAGRELMLLENPGGGVAILDYDNDGWPDMYLTQCCRWPVDLE